VRVLGIDPGTATTGFGIVTLENRRLFARGYGVVRTSAGQPLEKRLFHLHSEIEQLIKRFEPTEMAVESLFFNTNARSALAVGHARGVVLLAAAAAGLPVSEYTPLQVKQALVGRGRAEKAQVQFMVRAVLGLSETPSPDDAADALAVAVCHAHCAERSWV
jgi:crossover junction endodeoxyribonuclease RuvC